MNTHSRLHGGRPCRARQTRFLIAPDQATTRPAIQEMASDLHGAWACNGTSTWYFLDAWSGTPARCSREPGMIECATRVDGRECQWGRLFDKPAPYQPLRGVLTGAVIVVKCNHWRTNDGSDPCTQLGCYSNHAAHECEPETPLPSFAYNVTNSKCFHVDRAAYRSGPPGCLRQWEGAAVRIESKVSLTT